VITAMFDRSFVAMRITVMFDRSFVAMRFPAGRGSCSAGGITGARS